MNTITKVIANTAVTGEALNRAMRLAQSRYTICPRGMVRRWVYGSDGRELSSLDLFGTIVIEVEADTHHEDQ